jgi:hypothetical protein
LKGGAYVVIPSKLPAMKAMIGLALAGYGDLRIVKKLNDDKVPSPTGHRSWTYAFVGKTLKNPALVGRYEPKTGSKKKRSKTGEVWENYFPAIMTEKEWNQLRAARLSRRTMRGPIGKNVANLFTGLLVNARDGETYQRIVKNHARLISASYRNGLEGGDTQSFPYDPIEACFIYKLLPKLQSKALFGKEKAENKLDDLLNERTTVAARLAELELEIETGAVKALARVMAKLETRQEEIDQAIDLERCKQSDMDSNGLDDLQALVKLWASGSADVRTRLRARIRQLIEEIRMMVWGLKRSKYKVAELQIFFKAGGSIQIWVEVKGNTLVDAVVAEWHKGGIPSDYDFRHFKTSKTVKDYEREFANKWKANRTIPGSAHLTRDRPV